MTEQRRAALTSVTTNKKDKSSKKVSKTYRFVINLPEPTEQICPEFNFSELVKNAEKKKKDDKADSTKVQVNGLDPLEEDDQENLKAIARHYEEKYGGVKKRHGRFEDYCDLGAGYDETDPFIDNTDAYDEIVPDEMTTAHGGFYINSGALKFKEIPVTNGSDRDEVREKKRPKIKRTMTVEEGARILKKPKLDQHKKMAWIKKQALIKEQEMQKKRRRKQLAADDMARKKSATVKELLKERRGDLTSRGYPPEEPTPEPEAVVTSSNPPPVQDTVKTTVNSSITDAIESVVKASQISDDSSEEPDKPLSAPGSVKPVRSDVEECYDTENKEYGAREETEVKLPDNLSEDLVKMVDVLKQAAATSSSAGKSKFFSPDVNRTLLSIEMKVHNMSGGDRQSVYGHLASYLPCTRDTLMRRAKKLVGQQSEEMVKQPLRRLKILIDEMMPTLVRNYTLDYDRAVKEKSLQEAAVAEGKSENVNKVRIPRRRFQWTPETRSLLCEIVKIKLQYFELVKTRKENTMDMLTTYLDTRIRVLWPSGWMKTNNLIQESRSVHTRSGPLQESSNIPGPDTAIKDLKLQRKKYSWMDDVDERKKARKNASVNSSFLSNAVPCESRPSSSPITVQATTATALTNPSSKASKSVPMDLTMSAASTNSTSPSSKPVSVISQISDSVSITLTNVKSKNFPSEAALPSSLTVTPTTRIAPTGPGISKPPVFGKSKIGDVVITKTSVSPEKPRENVISNSVSTLRTVSDTSSNIYSSPISSNPPVLSSSVSKSKGIFDVNTNWTAPSPPVSKPVSSSLAHMNIPDCISVMPSYLSSSPAVPLTYSKPVTSISAISVSKPTAAPTVLKSTPSVPKSSTSSVLSSSIPPISMLPIMKPSTHSVISKNDTPLPSELTITAPSLSVSITSKPSPPIPKPGTPPSIPKSNTPPFISKPNTPPCIPKPSTPPSVIKSTSAAPVLSSTTPALSITGSFASGSVMKPAQSLSPSLSISKPPPLPSPPKPIMNLKQRILQGSSMIPPEPVVAPKKKEKEPAEDGIDIIEIIDEDTEVEGSSKDESEVHRVQKNSGALKHKTDSLTKKDYDMLGIADPKSYFLAGKKRDTEKHTSDDTVSNKRISSDLCDESASISDAETKRVKVGTLPTVDHNHTAAFDQQRRTIGALDAVSQIISESLSARPSSSTSHHHKEEKRHNKVLPSSSSEYRDLHQHSRPSFEPSKGIEEPENLKKKSNSSSPIDVETSVQIEMDRVMKELMQLQGHMSNERTSEDTSSPTSVIACSSSAPSSSSHSKHRDRSSKHKDDQPNASSKGFQDEFQKHLLQIKDSVSATDRTERHSEFAEQAPVPPMSSDQAAAYEDFSQSAVNSSNLPTPDITYNLPPSDLDSFTGFHFMGPLLSHLADLKSVANTTQTKRNVQ